MISGKSRQSSVFRYVGNRISQAESRLAGVKPPNSVTRIPKAFRGRGWKGIHVLNN